MVAHKLYFISSYIKTLLFLKNFRHVSMLQVLHKTNESMTKDTFIGSPRKKQEDPIEVLTKGTRKTFIYII